MSGKCCGSTDCRAATAGGSRLCAACRERVVAELGRLPRLYRGCEELLGNTRPRSIERIRGGRPAGIRLNDRAVAARTGVVAMLASWCVLVVAELGVPGPDRREPGPMADFLLAHLDWLARNPAAAVLADEIAEVTSVAADVVRPGATRELELGPCDQPGCGETVLAKFRAGSRAPQVSCTAGHVRSPSQWLALDRRIREGAA